MQSPEQDVKDRFPIWDRMQMLWMDVDPEGEIDFIARVCAESKYSTSELEQIYWNEVMPAVSFNLRFGNFIPEWTGFNEKFLLERIMEKHRFGKRPPLRKVCKNRPDMCLALA